MSDHYWTRASNAAADRLCPGRHLAQRGLEEPPGEFALFGRAVHAALAKGYPSGLDLKQHDIYESCTKIEAKVLADYFGEDAAKVKVVREKEYMLWFDGGKYEHRGHPDAVFRVGRKALIPDYKALNSEVPESATNLQLRHYACMVWANEPLLTEIAVVPIQPLVTHSPTICVYTGDAIAISTAEMYESVVRSHDPASPRIPGEVQCQWCLAKTKCAEYQRWAGSKVPVPLSLLEVPVALWTPEMRVAFCDGYSVAAKWLENCWAEMERLAKADPNAVPGYGMKEGSKPQPITDPQKVFERFEAQGGKLEQFMRAVGLAKGKLAEALSVVTGLRGKKLDDAFDSLVEGCVDLQKQNKASLVKLKPKE